MIGGEERKDGKEMDGVSMKGWRERKEGKEKKGMRWGWGDKGWGRKNGRGGMG